MLDGKRLIELPSKTVSLVKLEFSQEERDVYNMVCTQLGRVGPLYIFPFYQVEMGAQANFNKFLRAGTVLK